MEVAADLHLTVQLLFAVLALVLTFTFVRLWGAEGEWPRESCPRDKKEGKDTAAEQREKAAEEPSPAAEPGPALAMSIPQQPPTKPHKPEPQEDAGDHEPLPSKAEEEDLDSEKEQLVVREPASTAATPAPVTSTATSFESSEGFEWSLGTLETCLLILMGNSLLAHIQSVC
ncbi:hypothetical protein AAES_63878 [Amazona aestiva]|uniref:Matrix-remodeling-associated protein 7 n=1 Tax=Amazona aestiva TaxID=12930 RepID=A0A0Q3Q4C4_AMAAE|nr:hypothetical protein AAES_63878 [Amazona aestiva]